MDRSTWGWGDEVEQEQSKALQHQPEPSSALLGALGGLGGTASTYSFAREVRLLNSSTSKPLILLLERFLWKEKKTNFSLRSAPFCHTSMTRPQKSLSPNPSQNPDWKRDVFKAEHFSQPKKTPFPKPESICCSHNL